MASTYIKASKVVNTMLGVLERDTTLAQLVWRDAAGDFTGALNDTISIRLPAYTLARTRTLRGLTGLTVDDLTETKVDVTLDTHIYKAVGVTDEQLTLDITDFGAQVIAPASNAVVRGIDDLVAAEMVAAPYQSTANASTTDPYPALVNARASLNLMNVPMDNRFIAVGANFEAALLKSDKFTRYDNQGDSAVTALQTATIGRIAGMPVVTSIGLDPDWAIVAHRTAFVLSLKAPAVPAGAPWGQSASAGGFAIRNLRDYDFGNATGPRDRFLADVFAGTDIAKDRGVIDGSGKFQPSTDGNASPIFIRAVKLVLEGQS